MYKEEYVALCIAWFVTCSR